MDKRSSCDLLSNLPLGIIHAILERVPIRDAVRTSILSRQWKYKWASLSHLTFDDTTVDSSEFKLEHFITQLLLLHQGPIIKFKVDSESPDIADSLCQWVCFLSRNGIRMLSLRFCLASWPSMRIPASIYSCQNLTHLEIYDISLPPPPPSFKSFPCLKCLVLVDIFFDSAIAFNTLFADLPLLEEMTLNTEEGFYEEVRVNAPNLKILDLSIDGIGDICIYAPILSEMSIRFRSQRETSVSKYNKLLGGLALLETLKGDSFFFEFLRIGIESCHTPLVFPHLRFIELSPEIFYDKKVEPVIAHLCKGAPNLHKLKVTYMHSRYPGLKSLCLDSECPFNFTFEQLKVLEFDYPYFGNDVGAISGWMKLIKCLLARSPALETLICVRPCMSDSELLELASTLLTYPRASPISKIVFRKR